MSLSAIRYDGILFFDGVEIMPSVETVEIPTEGIEGFDINKILYKTFKLEIPIELGDINKLKFKFLISPGSTVELTTESFLSGLGDFLAYVDDKDLSEVATGCDGYAGVITVGWATVNNCSFLGQCNVMMVRLDECSAWDSSFMDITDKFKPINVFHGLNVIDSKIAHSKISPNTTVKCSRVINSEISNDNEGNGINALAAEIEDSDIHDSVIEGQGRTDILACNLKECTFGHAGFMRITNQRLANVDVKADNIDLWSKFCFFTVNLPYIDINVFTTRADDWHMYCEDFPERSYNVDTDLVIFGEKVKTFLENMLGKEGNEETIGSCLDFLKDSIDSRRALLKVIDSI